MLYKTELISFSTMDSIQIVDITTRGRGFCRFTRVQNGLLTVESLHTTGGIAINEKCEALTRDTLEFFEKLVPRKGNYRHNEVAVDGRDNAHSHMLGYFLRHSETIAIADGELTLGQWQSLFFVELDGPRTERQVRLTMVGE